MFFDTLILGWAVCMDYIYFFSEPFLNVLYIYSEYILTMYVYIYTHNSYTYIYIYINIIYTIYIHIIYTICIHIIYITYILYT